MYHTVLVPLDGSTRSEAILRHVEELAVLCRATVILLRVIEPIPPSGVEDTYTAAYDRQLLVEGCAEQAEYYLATIQGKLREKGVTTKVRVAYGNVVQAIKETVQHEGVNLIAMASRGRSGSSRLFLGSVTASVLHAVDQPLLLIRS